VLQVDGPACPKARPLKSSVLSRDLLVQISLSFSSDGCVDGLVQSIDAPIWTERQWYQSINFLPSVTACSADWAVL